MADDRAAIARAYARATQVATIAIGMVVPPIAGHFADGRLGTKVVFTILGAFLGLVYGIWHLLKMGRRPDPPGAGAAPKPPSSEDRARR